MNTHENKDNDPYIICIGIWFTGGVVVIILNRGIRWSASRLGRFSPYEGVKIQNGGIGESLRQS
jgi:hypothetical protein